MIHVQRRRESIEQQASPQRLVTLIWILPRRPLFLPRWSRRCANCVYTLGTYLPALSKSITSSAPQRRPHLSTKNVRSRTAGRPRCRAGNAPGKSIPVRETFTINVGIHCVGMHGHTPSLMRRAEVHKTTTSIRTRPRTAYFTCVDRLGLVFLLVETMSAPN